MPTIRLTSISGALKLVTGRTDWRDAASTVSLELHESLRLLDPPYDPRYAAGLLGIEVVDRPILDDGLLIYTRRVERKLTPAYNGMMITSHETSKTSSFCAIPFRTSERGLSLPMS